MCYQQKRSDPTAKKREKGGGDKEEDGLQHQPWRCSFLSLPLCLSFTSTISTFKHGIQCPSPREDERFNSRERRERERGKERDRLTPVFPVCDVRHPCRRLCPSFSPKPSQPCDSSCVISTRFFRLRLSGHTGGPESATEGRRERLTRPALRNGAFTPSPSGDVSPQSSHSTVAVTLCLPHSAPLSPLPPALARVTPPRSLYCDAAIASLISVASPQRHRRDQSRPTTPHPPLSAIPHPQEVIV